MKTVSVTTFLITALTAQVNAAERNCASKHTVIESLTRKIGEIAFATGIATGTTVKFFGNSHHDAAASVGIVSL